jgi:hypothetical protein
VADRQVGYGHLPICRRQCRTSKTTGDVLAALPVHLNKLRLSCACLLCVVPTMLTVVVFVLSVKAQCAHKHNILIGSKFRACHGMTCMAQVETRFTFVPCATSGFPQCPCHPTSPGRTGLRTEQPAAAQEAHNKRLRAAFCAAADRYATTYMLHIILFSMSPIGLLEASWVYHNHSCSTVLLYP